MASETEPGRAFLGWGAAVVAVLIWAGWIVVTRDAATKLAPADVAVLRYGGPALLLAPVWLRRGVLPRDVGWLRIAIMTLGWGTPFAWLGAQGLQKADVGLFAALVPGAMPLWAAAMGMAALGWRFAPLGFAGLALVAAGAGMALAVAPASAYAGLPWVFGAAIGWAAYTHGFRGSGLTPIEATAIVAFWSTLMTIPAAFAGAVTLPDLPLSLVATQFMLHGVLSGVISVAAYALAIRELGAQRASSMSALVPVLAGLGGWLFLGEALKPATAAGIVLTGCGVALLASASARRA